MKSKRAKKHLDHAVGEAYEFTYDINIVELSMAERAVEFAEQDAEERAVKAFCGTCSHSTYPTCDLDICIERERFKELLNNGGQSDE